MCNYCTYVYTCTYSVYSVGHPLAFHTFVLENPHMGSNISPPSYGQTAYKSLLWETIVCMTQQTNLVDLLLIFLFRNTQTRWWQLKYFSFSPRKLGKMNRFWRAYVSKRLVQPPARKPLFLLHKAKVLPTSQAFLLIFLNLKGSQSCREGSWLNSSQRGFRFFFFFFGGAKLPSSDSSFWGRSNGGSDPQGKCGAVGWVEATCTVGFAWRSSKCVLKIPITLCSQWFYWPSFSVWSIFTRNDDTQYDDVLWTG